MPAALAQKNPAPAPAPTTDQAAKRKGVVSIAVRAVETEHNVAEAGTQDKAPKKPAQKDKKKAKPQRIGRQRAPNQDALTKVLHGEDGKPKRARKVRMCICVVLASRYSWISQAKEEDHFETLVNKYRSQIDGSSAKRWFDG